jgi:hypothetical protein
MTRPTVGDMEKVLLEMVDKFKKRIPGEYSNSILTTLASNHPSTLLFLQRFATNLAYQLRSDPDFVFKKGTIQSYKVNENNQAIMNNRPDLPSPLFSDGKTNGLALAVNDTWGYDVFIKNFIIDKSTRKLTAVLDIELYDHFGLDTPDICFPKSACTPPENPKEFMVVDNLATFKWMTDGFVSWFILQHDNTRCYKPFVTVMKFEKIIRIKY